jgi:REP-associated tyrosine transposase
MPRFARIHVTGGLFHVISRFHDRRFYLDVEGAREKYLELLGKAAETHDSRIIAYCLMSSHVHLVLQLGNDSLGSLAKKVHSPFGIWLNSHRKGRGLGTIMADRPKSVLVHSETYGVELIRYVHNNPVRAGIVGNAEDSCWSSHRAYLGLEPSPPWLITEALLGTGRKKQEKIRDEFAQYVEDGREEKRRPEFSGEVTKTLARRMRKLLGGDVELSYPVLGPDEFVVSVLKNQAQKNQNNRKFIAVGDVIPRLIKEVFGLLGLDSGLARKRIRTAKVAKGRALVAWIWVEILGRPQVMVAEGLNVRSTAVSGMIAKLRREGFSKEEAKMIDTVFERVTEGDDTTKSATTKSKASEHKVIALKRKR